MARAPQKTATSEKVRAKSRRDEDEDVLDEDVDEDTESDTDTDTDDEDVDETPRRKTAPKGKSAAAGASKSKAKPSRNDDDDDEDGDTINWADVDEQEGGDLEVIPRGKYATTVDESEFSLSKEGQNPMITLRLEITDGDYSGRKLWYRVVLTKKTLGMVKHSLRVLGVKMPSKEMSWNGAKRWFEKLADSGDLIGQECAATVKIRTYEGEKRNEVRSIHSAGEATADGDDDFME